MAKSRSSSSASSGTSLSDSEDKAISTKESQSKRGSINRQRRPDGRLFDSDEFRFRWQHDKYYRFREDDEHPPLSYFNARFGSRSPSRSPWRPGKLTRKEQAELDDQRWGHLMLTPEEIKARNENKAREDKEKKAREEELRQSRAERGRKRGRSRRGRSNDHYDRTDNSDPRRFKVHYEDTPSREVPKEFLDRWGYKSSEEFFHSEGQSRRKRASDSRNDQQKEHDRGRRRDRSRSPFRHGKLSSHTSNDNERHRRDSRSDTEYSHRDSKPHMSSSQEATPKREATEKNSTDQNVAGRSKPVERSRISNKASEGQEEADEVRPQLSEAEQIEQRRKMREAIRAKHRNNPPLLVQALEQNIPSAPATPAHDSSGRASEQHSPESMGSPSTPHRDSPPGSPAAFVVNDDEELVERRHVDGSNNEDDGPSAADYDPNLDMQEDRPDHKRQDLLEPTSIHKASQNQVQGSKPKEFDMFAEDDDDDDMFAPVDKVNKSATGGTIQARTLDAGMLDNWDYPDGHYKIIIGELLDDRYAVQQQIGKGTFATVVRAQDTRTGQQVAVKIACNNQTMYKAGQKEMDMLRLLNDEDPDDKKHIIRLHRHFDHKGHLCIVFENLSADLREVLKKFGRNVGLNLRAIRSYAQQMFMALSHLKTCKILHADLKPDNMLVSEKRSLLKICDLGTAAFARDAEITPYLVSRFYRAPEVILGVEIDYAIDMWSIGCTLFELYTGRILFAGADNNQMLRVIQESRGKIPNRILKRSALVDKHFDVDGNFVSQEHDKLTGKATIRQLNFNKIGPGKDLRTRLSGNIKDMKPEEAKEHAAFVDLLDKCLQLDPTRRISPNEALRHKFITHSEKSDKTSVKLAMNVPRKA